MEEVLGLGLLDAACYLRTISSFSNPLPLCRLEGILYDIMFRRSMYMYEIEKP